MVSSDSEGDTLDNFRRKTLLDALFGTSGRRQDPALSASWKSVLGSGERRVESGERRAKSGERRAEGEKGGWRV